jgi:hypothetical protein
LSEKTTFEPPKCPAYGANLFRVAENIYETYKFNPSTGCYGEVDGEAEMTCLECGAELYTVFPDGVCNYRVRER